MCQKGSHTADGFAVLVHTQVFSRKIHRVGMPFECLNKFNLFYPTVVTIIERITIIIEYKLNYIKILKLCKKIFPHLNEKIFAFENLEKCLMSSIITNLLKIA